MQEVKIHNAVMYLFTQCSMHRGKNMPHNPSSGHDICHSIPQCHLLKLWEEKQTPLYIVADHIIREA